ncbi:guanine nucleotide binding protein, alpha subunit [Gorgonomyces haynaldii]|nr:guanine nucleotide binding protein, alpha subunit [Gorgonomyces haynaldii]
MLAEESKKLQEEKHMMLLLLGPADSGKSTVLKQMILLHGHGFSQEDRLKFKTIIHRNMVKNMKILLESNGRILQPGGIHIMSLNVSEITSFLPETLEAFDKLLSASFIQKDLQSASKFGVDDTALFFFKEAKRVLHPDYIPSDQDVLSCRMKTESVIETVFSIDDVFWHVVDVAGQRDKRDRWSPYFEKVKSILYIFSTASYNQTLEESPDVNRIVDSTELFTQLVNHPTLKTLSFIIFYNKIDLLESRLEKFAVKNYLSDFEGENTVSQYLDYLKSRFKKAMGGSQVPCFNHRTTATDTKQMRKVIVDVKQAIFRDQMDLIL